MKILQVIAHPDLSLKSFTGQLSRSFKEGAAASGHSVVTYNLYDIDYCPSHADFKALILKADHINFAWPCLWEMPPAKMVDFFQTIFVKDFAFTLINDKMKPTLDIHVSCLISMGQDKDLSTINLSEAMSYCGLHPTFHLYKNVGPRLTPTMAQLYLDTAYSYGTTI